MAAKSEGATHCYLRISVAGADPKTVVIRLYSEECPETCRNFVTLCSSTAVASRKQLSQEPTYRRSEFHRIIPGFMVQGGDYENFDGTGGKCAISDRKTFDDESFAIPHDREGVVSMANRGKNTNGSQFFITLAKTSHLDGKHVAFGQVISGMDIVKAMVGVETEGSNGKPIAMQRIIVVDCGPGTGDCSSSSSSDVSSASEDERSSRNKKRRKKDHKRDRKRSSSRRSEKRRRREDKSHSRKENRSDDSDDSYTSKSRSSSRHESQEFVDNDKKGSSGRTSSRSRKRHKDNRDEKKRRKQRSRSR
mmetsp:Transcript_26220/g.47578  ORF Transcript_26220/g.47578 Transcript_26220/m.47578 type:complete len:306 (-) Transcript_26220:198-1115(-)|eukprot:CAMPEP_0198297120 /NCGR_PEP_ID=MMETSP1449-20131203/35540_1 /TAXON_ID=420275 /ORGANISM="Attheya septentrionalis, Strain CCMP2084" /LENGTH=305 /DNA_ID=CAMNT_0043997957 /DNA_START=33 /DNA_END=950 /DNA_ORIENTATION=+